MKGRTLDEARAQLKAKNLPESEVERIAPHRVFSGNRPSLTLVHDKLDPFALGRLVALYEHRVFVEAQIFGINAFDQWGVELGRNLPPNFCRWFRARKRATVATHPHKGLSRICTREGKLDGILCTARNKGEPGS